MKNNLLLLILLFFTIDALAQHPNSLVRKGNASYTDTLYSKAEQKYREALMKDQNSYAASFNLADAIYKQEKFSESTSLFKALSEKTQNKIEKSESFHNLGNSRMQQEDYAGAVDAYKESLRNNPKDDRTRYNLSEAIRRLKDQERKNPPQDINEPQDPNDPQDPQDPQDGNDAEDKEGGDQNSDQDGQGDEKKDPKNGSSRSNGSKKDGEGQLPNQMIERTLDNLARKEAETKQRMRGGGKAGKPSKSGKDW